MCLALRDEDCFKNAQSCGSLEEMIPPLKTIENFKVPSAASSKGYFSDNAKSLSGGKLH